MLPCIITHLSRKINRWFWENYICFSARDNFYTKSSPPALNSRRWWLVFCCNILWKNQRICDKLAFIQVFLPQIHCSDSAVSVGFVVVDARGCIAAAGIDGFFQTMGCLYTTFLLFHTSQNMKELGDGINRGSLSFSIVQYKSCPYESGRGG